MKKIEPNIDTLIDKLIISVDLYDKASKRVHDDMLKEQFDLQKQRKVDSLEQLAQLMNIDLSAHRVSIADHLKVSMEKIGIEIDHIYIRQNAHEVLSFCLKRESELIESYRKVLAGWFIDKKTNSLLKRQLDDSAKVHDQLKSLYKAYDFQEA